MKILGIAGALLLSCLTREISCASLNGTVNSIPSFPSNSTSDDLIQPFIVGGVPAVRNEFPWIVHLAITAKDGVYLCGGALIKLDLVLTAAHCVTAAKDQSSIKVTAGDHIRNGNEPNRQTETSKSIKYHENYHVDSNDKPIHDIAVIKLKNAFKQTAAVRPINVTLANSTVDPTANGNGTVAGWGTTREDGSTSGVLMKVNVTIVTNASCTNIARDRSNQFCAGNPGRDSCQGDSGGPFICLNDPTRVCGIVSYGAGCGRAGYPGVYTKVSAYEAWITKNDSTGLLSSLAVLIFSVFVNFSLF